MIRTFLHKVNIKKKYIIIQIAIVFFIVVSYLSLTSLYELRGNARVVNYVGIVRGATQKLVKRELHGYTDNTLITKLDLIIDELISGTGPNNLIVLHEPLYLNNMNQVSEAWSILKNEIQAVRAGADKDALFNLSEEYFILVDKTVSSAEAFSEVQVGNSIALLVGTIGLFVLLIIIAIIYFIRSVAVKRHAELLSKIAFMDQLTGLINNAGLQDTAVQFMASHVINGYSFVHLDIVSFSRINNMYGYSAGDMVLRSIARAIREQYMCGTRITADRFAFFAQTGEKMVSEMERAFYAAIEKEMGNECIHLITFKFGIFPMQQGKYSFRQIYDGALLALKNAKKQHKYKQVTYDAELKKVMELNRTIEMNMLRALQKEEFLMYLQPQFSAYDECCCGAESLIRWQSDVMGFVFPDSFIPLFEHNGFIVEIDFYMLEKALYFLQNTICDSKTPITIAVNQSKVTILFCGYLQRLQDLISRYDVPLNFIELEITENALENELDNIIPLLNSLKQMGFMIALDDFGSGFSSLNTLRILSIDVLKIDKAFLQEADTSERSKHIISNIINMAKDLHIKIICEGVETEAQFEFLKSAGCDIIQGYYFSKPIPIDQFEGKYLQNMNTPVF